MATIYICKCGRRVRKSTNADNTGNRDTAGCRGCPYLLPWGPTEWTGKGFEQNIQGHECRMSPEISYATDYSGSANDKCTLKIHSLDLDFLEDIQAWIDEYADGQLSGRFSRDTIRGTDYCNKGRYSWSISCAQNKKGMAAKAALIERFFGPDKHRLDKTPEEEKAIVLAAIEAGKAKASGKEKDMQVYTNQYGTLFAVREHNGSPALMCKAKESEQWVMSGVLAAVKDDAKTIGELQAVLDKAAQKYNWEPVENVPVENPTNAAEDVQQCAPTASDVLLSQSQSVNADAQQGGGDDSENPTYSAVATAAAEETAATPEPLDLASMMAVSAAKTNAEVVDATNKVAASSNLPDVCRDCQCATCGNEGCASPCWENPREVGDCEITGPAGDACRDYRPKEDAQCQKENAPSVGAAATMEKSAARMCEGPDEETQTTPAAASGAALESLHAQSVLPQNAPAQDIAVDAPSAQAFDYSGLDDQTVADLHLAEREYSSGKKMAEMGLRRMADAVAIAHGAVVAICENGKDGKFSTHEDTFLRWCASVGLKKDSAYRMLQVSKLMDGSSPREQKVLEELSPSLLYAAAKPSAPAELVQAVKDGDITTHKRYQEALAEIKARDAKIQELLEMSEGADRRADAAEARAQKAEQERDAARDAQAASSRLTNMITNQRDEAQIRAERAELRAKAAEEDAAGWKQAGLEMQELVDQRDERIRELESGITVETTAADQEEIERRANELSEPLVKIINQQNEEIQQLAAGNTVSAQASVLEHYLKTMEASLLSNAQRAELASYDIGALDSLARALREFADSIDGIFEEGEENEE
ncbi:hypothetical protein [uncultured Allofournierella sp.]|uniref:hypothetical protein n=1 Tax=uncultured Allofournierella sp. TaxID=1940258 RepID=UPI0025CFCEA5|nr:hypothetical protein [uncultured Fournierella sp.]